MYSFLTFYEEALKINSMGGGMKTTAMDKAYLVNYITNMHECNCHHHVNKEQWHTQVILTFGSLKQEDLQFEASMDYPVTRQNNLFVL